MEKCPPTSKLSQWISGTLERIQVGGLSDHVQQCEQCQRRLDEMTSQQGIDPPEDVANALKAPTYTDERQFQEMRKNIAVKVAKLKHEELTERHHPDSKQGGPAKQDQADTDDPAQDPTLPTESTDDFGSVSQGAKIDGFRVESLIGSGGFAHVFEAWDEKLSRTVAIKLLDRKRLNARNRHRFLREAKAASAIRSPQVVQVLSSGETSAGQPYIVMELVPGISLAQWVNAQTQLDESTIDLGVNMLVQICEGTQAVHDAGLVHRDIKPGNIFVSPESGVAKLGDFGLARVLADDTLTLTQAAELLGTPAYMSPEQTLPEGNVDSKSDIYNLGATLYQLLTGQPPFRGSSIAILKQINESEPLLPRLLNESVSRDLETICLKALEKDPARRYASATLLAEDLRHASEGKPIQARPITRIQRAWRWARRNAALATSLGVLFASLLVGTIVSTSLWLRAEAAEQQAVQDRTAAEAAEQQAVQDRTAALKSLNSVLGTLYEDLTRSGASIKTRESVVQAAVEGLESFAEIGGDVKTTQTAMLSYRRIGNLMSLNGSKDKSEQAFARAIEIGRELLEREPDSIDAKCSLASALGDQANLHTTFQQKRQLAKDFRTESIALLKEAIAENPQHRIAWSQLVRLQGSHLNGLHSDMVPQQIIDESPEILTDVAAFIKLAPDDQWAFYRAHDIYFKIGRAHYQLRNYEKAIEQLSIARKHLARATTLSTDKQANLEHEAVLDRVEGLAYYELSDFENCLRLALRSLVVAKQLVKEDPDNISRLSGLGGTYSTLMAPYLAMGEFDLAIEMIQKAIDISTSLLAKTPGNDAERLFLCEGYQKLASLQMYQFRWVEALASYQSYVRYAESPEFGDPISNPNTIYVLGLAKRSIEGLELLIGKSSIKPNEMELAPVLLFLSRRDAKTATDDNLTEQSLEILDRLDPELGIKTMDDLFARFDAMSPEVLPSGIGISFKARVSALKAQSLANNPEAVDLRDKWITKAISLLESQVQQNPQQKNAIVFNDPDLIWLRGTDEFKNSSLSNSE